MTRALSVVALIDSPTPFAWVKQLIDRLERRNGIDLHIVVTEPDPGESERQHELVDQRSTSLVGQLADAILRGKIDKPLFAQDPWTPEKLDVAASFTRSDTSTALPHCDVIINLTTSVLPEAMFPDDDTPAWDAHVETLDARLEDALLRRASLNWVHLWAHHRNKGDGSAMPSGVSRIATHALPRQSYSYTDLQRAAYFSLVTLFESRLVWLYRGADIVRNEYSQSSPLADGQLIDPERHAAHAQANWLKNHGFLPLVTSDASRLKRTLATWFHQSVDRIRHRLWYEQWQLGFLKNEPGTARRDADTINSNCASVSASSLAVLTGCRLADFTNITSPDKTWWADPHLYQHDGSLYVFFEEMRIDADHGHLSVARLSDDGQPSDVITILDDGQHLSYPFVFGADEHIYMIPETASRKCVLLYRAERFPDRWTLVKELLTGIDLADSTVHFDGQRWWMFTNAMSHRSIDERDELHLYSADEITGPWIPHPMNPVVTGVDRARMAGSVFRDGASLYRPSQYGAVRYGYGINLHRIDILNCESYSEVIVGRLLPEPRSPWLGCHSISHANGATVLDRITRHRR